MGAVMDFLDFFFEKYFFFKTNSKKYTKGLLLGFKMKSKMVATKKKKLF